MSFLVKNFLRGLVIVIPLAVTSWVLWIGFRFVDRLLRLPIPGLGFLLAIVLIVVIGLLGSNLVTRKLFEALDRLFVRAPFVKIVYTALRDLTEAFVGDRRRFDRPVRVRLTDDGGVAAVGFVTRETAVDLGAGEHVVVYLPQSYNFAGQLLVVRRDHVEELSLDAARAMALVVSGGVSGLERADRPETP